MPGLDLVKFHIAFELDQMSEYLVVIHSSIEKQLDAIEERYQEALKKEMDEDQAMFREDYYNDQFFTTSIKFPQLLLQGFIVNWFSFIEQELLGFCEAKKLRITIGPKDNAKLESGIKRARNFLFLSRGYEIDKDHWNTLGLIAKLRNYLVHEGDQFHVSLRKPEKNYIEYTYDGGTYYCIIEPNFYNFLVANKLIETNGMIVKIVPTFEYCHALIEFAKVLFNKLFEEIK